MAGVKENESGLVCCGFKSFNLRLNKSVCLKEHDTFKLKMPLVKMYMVDKIK